MDGIRQTVRFVPLAETFIDTNFGLSGVFAGFSKFIYPASNLSDHGKRSGGIVVLVKKRIASFAQEVQDDCVNILVLKIAKDIFGCDSDTLYLSTYVPPSSSPFYNPTE